MTDKLRSSSLVNRGLSAKSLKRARVLSGRSTWADHCDLHDLYRLENELREIQRELTRQHKKSIRRPVLRAVKPVKVKMLDQVRDYKRTVKRISVSR